MTIGQYHPMNSSLLAMSLALILLWASPKPSVASTFLSIDCGASQSYNDSNSIKWVGDGDYVRSGVSYSVDSSDGEVFSSTLRAFPTLDKNCYTINVDQFGDRILVRASFYYGNYDQKLSPPSFGLLLDGNNWTTVNMSGFSFSVVNTEAIYTPKTNTTTVCLTRMVPDQIPFISALELRSLDSNMYYRAGSDRALFSYPSTINGKVQRYAAGVELRYRDDVYDRIWYNVTGDLLGRLEVVRNKAPVNTIDVTSGAEDKPPAAAFQNAIAANSVLTHLQLLTDLPDYDVPVYITAYFSEVTPVSSADKRSFQLYADDSPYSDPIVPPFGSVMEVVVTNITASSSTVFELRATSDATLPPLINAHEVYILSSNTAGTTPPSGPSPSFSPSTNDARNPSPQPPLASTSAAGGSNDVPSKFPGGSSSGRKNAADLLLSVITAGAVRVFLLSVF